MTVDYLSVDGSTYTVRVDLSEANVPEGAYLQVEELSDDEAEEYIKDAAKAVDTKVKDLLYSKALDISIIYNNEKIQPDGAVKVEVKLQDKEKNIVSEVVHFGNETEVLDSETDGKTVEFTTKGFSVFAIVGTGTITVPFVAGDGRTYEVTVTYGEDAGIPAGSTLAVSELREDSEEYQDYLEQTADAVGTAADALNYIKILDISIMNGEEEVVIQAPVDVQIKLLDKDHAEGSAGEKTKVVHFGESETDVIDHDLNGTTVNFEAAGFSYYAVTTYGATSDLAGKSYAIVWVKTVPMEIDRRERNHNFYRGRALATDAWKNNTTRLNGVTVTVETHESGRNLVTGDGAAPIVEWKFESAGPLDTYYIKADGKYLNLNGTDSLELSDTPQALTVTAGTGDYEGKVKISYDTRSVQSSMKAATTDTVNDNQYFYNGNSKEAGQVYLTLCECEVKEFKIEEGQNGVIFIVNGELKGLELFYNHSIYKEYHEKLCRSYIIEAIVENKSEDNIDRLELMRTLENISHSESKSLKSIGLGDNIKFSNDFGSGSGLVYEEELIHMTFVKIEDIEIVI